MSVFLPYLNRFTVWALSEIAIFEKQYKTQLMTRVLDFNDFTETTYRLIYDKLSQIGVTVAEDEGFSVAEFVLACMKFSQHPDVKQCYGVIDRKL